MIASLSRCLSIKTVAKSITPPIVWNMLRDLVSSRIDGNILYEGCYDTFSEITNRSLLYDTSESLDEARMKAVQKYRTIHENRFGIPQPSGDSCRGNLLTLLVAHRLNELGSLKVLDVGGRFCITYIDCLSSVEDSSKISWHIYETDRVVEMGDCLKKDDLDGYGEEVFFFNYIPKDRYDLVYFGSVLQFIENYRDIVKQILVRKPKDVLITDTPIYNGPTVVSAQVNMKNRILPVYIFGLSDLRKLFEVNGYTLIYKSATFCPFHNFDNFEDEKRNILFTNLLFRHSE